MRRVIFNLILLSFFLSSDVSFAQSIVKWGPSYKIKGGADMYKFLGVLDNSYYFVFKPNSDNIVQRFNFRHELVSEEKFKFVRNRERLKIHGAIETAAGSYFYMHQFSRKYKEWILHVSEVNNGNISRPEEAYFQSFDLPNTQLNKAYRNFEYDFGPVDGGLILSEDSTKVAFVNIIPDTDLSGEDVVAVAVFDETMKLIWKAVFYYDFGGRRYDIERQVVTNDGEIYLVGRVDKFKREDRGRNVNERKLPKFDYYLYHINEEGILDSKIDLGVRNAPMDVALFFPDRNTDQFLMAGFYTDDTYKFRLKGIFFSYGDENFRSTSVRMHEFDERFLSGLISSKAIEKGKGLSSTYRIKDILNYRDGSIGFIAENSYTSDFSQTDIYGRWFQRVVFVSDEIIIPKFNSDGDLINIQKIPKDFSSEVYTSTSYSMAVHSGKTYLIFNDYKSREERAAIDKRGSVFTDLVVLDELGRIEGVQTLFTNREINYDFFPALSDYNHDVFLIGSKRGNRFSMSSLEFGQ